MATDGIFIPYISKAIIRLCFLFYFIEKHVVLPAWRPLVEFMRRGVRAIKL